MENHKNKMTTKYDAWRKAYENYLLGTQFDPNSDDGKKIISSLVLFTEGSLKKPDLLTAFVSPTIHISSLSLVYRTPGNKYYNNPDTLNTIIDELSKLKETYNLQTDYSNWWVVEVGNPLRVLNSLILLYDHLGNIDEYISYWCEVFLHFQDSYTKITRGRPETGANMMWKCHIQILTGILLKNDALIQTGKENLSNLFHYSQKVNHPQIGSFYDDGFYEDGSFIQHYFFAYTGGYGKHFINILSGLLFAFKNTDMNILSDSNIEFFCEMIEKCYAPLLVNGRFMDISRGRESSRSYYQDYICGRHVMRSLLYLSEVVPENWRKKICLLLKQNLSFSDNRSLICVDENSFAEYCVYPSLGEILSRFDKDSVNYELIKHFGHYNFGVMSKVVHRHGDWSSAVSMYSKYMSCYEYLNGESLKFWHMSDGVTYLYTTDSDQYNGDFFATVDMQRLPGITVDRNDERYNDPYYNWFSPESKNVYSFSGGTSLGEYGIAGLQYRGQGKGKERDLEVKKSWFFIGEEIVCIGNDISSTTGDQIEAIVLNHRLVNCSNCFLSFNRRKIVCNELNDNDVCGEIKYIHLTGNKDHKSDIGVVFPKGGNVHAIHDHRKGTWNSINLVENHVWENDFLTVWLSHGVKPKNDDYCYILLPGFDFDETLRYSNDPDIEILECSSNAHAVKNKNGTTGINFWKEGTCSGITVDKQACVMFSILDKALKISISDPTNNDSLIEVKTKFNVSSFLCKDEIEVVSTSPLEFRANSKGKNGQNMIIEATL